MWKRFIDDVFSIWTNSEENLERFLKELNGFHPSIKFTFEKSKMKVNFLDVVIKIKNGRLSTDFYSKPVDSHQYLHYNSCHPENIKKSIIYSQTLRLRRICSERKDLKSHVRDLKGWFLRRGYPQQIIEEQMDRAFRLPLENDTQQNKMENRIALVVTYSNAFRNLSTTLQKNFNILYSDLLVAYRSARNLKNFFVRSKVYPLERTVGSSKCGSKRCQVCLNVSETDIFESFQTKRQYKINHHLDCNDKCLIYLLSCKICGLQYVGSTTDRFRLRWNNYKDNGRKAQQGEEHMQPELQDCSITLIDKTNGSDPTRREEYWCVVFKTVTLYGLNRIE